MTPEERQLLKNLFDRVQIQGSAPRDPQAEAFIGEAVHAFPYAPYLLAQAVIVQDHALQAADGRLQELEQRVHELESSAIQQPGAGGGSFLGGAGRTLYGDGHYGVQAPKSAAPSAPQAGPWAQSPPHHPDAPSTYSTPAPQAWGNVGVPHGGGLESIAASQPTGGGSFLHGALAAAAGVAGSVLLADSLRGFVLGDGNPFDKTGGVGGDLINSMSLGGGLMSPMGFGGGETVANNYYETSADGRTEDAADTQAANWDGSGNLSGGDDSTSGSIGV